MKQINSFSVFAATLAAVFLFSACKKDPPPLPTVKLLAQVSGHDVTLTIEATNATTFAWNYGDTKTSTLAALSHVYKYAYSGTYTVTVTVTGDGGTANASKSVTIDPEPTEILSGTPSSHPNGKIWVLDPKYWSGKNGAGPLTATLPITLDFLGDNVLGAMLGLGAEYDNEFTFKYDGSLSINNKNGVSLGSAMYAGVVAGTGPASGFEGGMGICGISYTPVAGTWQLKKENLTLPVIIEDPANLAGGFVLNSSLTLTNQMYIDPTSYFGFLDITKKVLVMEITSGHMHVVFLMHGVVQDPTKPSTALHVTFIPKN